MSETQNQKRTVRHGSILYYAKIQSSQGGHFPVYRLELKEFEAVTGYGRKVKIVPRFSPIRTPTIDLDRQSLEAQGYAKCQDGLSYHLDPKEALRILVDELRRSDPDAEFTYAPSAFQHQPR